jgi:hypothetical protein
VRSAFAETTAARPKASVRSIRAEAPPSVGLYSGTVPATPSTVTTTILAKSRFADIDLKAHSPGGLWRSRIKTRGSSDLYVVDNKLAPGATTGWHSHPGPSLIQVVAGSVTN